MIFDRFDRKLKRHERIHTGEVVFKCPTCEKCFVQFAGCKQHIEAVHCDESNDKPLICSMCTKRFSKNSCRNRHIKCVHTEEQFKPFKCESCDREIDCHEEWARHELTHFQGGKPFECAMCKERFPHKSMRKLHMKRSHNSKKLLKCLICGEDMKSRDELKKHEILHLRVRLFKCFTCEQRFPCERVGYDVPRELLPSVELSRLPIGKADAQGRFRVMTGCEKLNIKPGSTSGATYRSKPNTLMTADCTRRERTHTSEKPFKCPTCEKCFALKSQCKQHMKLVHTDERPFKCQLCDKKFYSATDHKRHERVHTGEKPFQCPMCEKRFARTSNRNKHMKRVHADEKEFKCQVCDKRFITPADCKQHERIHTSEKPFKCPTCEKCFTRKDSCKNHMKHIHNDTFDSRSDVQNDH
ncbi:zinc finger Y-chromosomal protein 1-like [Tubulanus polymorphus]|uniref:zinc finger Y-chromosomal protein 1-like n=1 Tax=Tubulanus polymorphus TaxID=672921 RepID=UPI003DA5DC31